MSPKWGGFYGIFTLKKPLFSLLGAFLTFCHWCPVQILNYFKILIEILTAKDGGGKIAAEVFL